MPPETANGPVDLDAKLDELARQFGFTFGRRPLDQLRGPKMIADRKLTELALFLKLDEAAKQQAARAELLGGAAFEGAQPTPEEMAAFRPGRPVSGLLGARPTPGVPEGTVDPALAAELQSELRAEELNRAAERNAPAVGKLQQQLLTKDAGFDLNNLALSRLHQAQAGGAELRRGALAKLLENPDIDPLLAADVAQNKDVFKPQRVKVKHRDGREVYYDARPTLAGGYTYSPALDEAGAPLQVPITASASAPTALQKNAQFVARVLFAGDADAERKSVELLTRLKGKASTDAWSDLTREVARMQYGRYARDPQRLYEKTAEIWRVARPGEPIPTEPPPAAAPPPTGGAPAPSEPGAGAGQDVYSQARAAIAKGANREAVKQRLKQMGHDPSKL